MSTYYLLLILIIFFIWLIVLEFKKIKITDSTYINKNLKILSHMISFLISIFTLYYHLYLKKKDTSNIKINKTLIVLIVFSILNIFISCLVAGRFIHDTIKDRSKHRES